MSYVITTTSGNVLMTLQDGTTDSTTGVVLIGKNYTGYGLPQNDNFVRLLENFAGPIPPNQSVGTAILTGTVWYDTANHLIKVYDGTNFSPVSGRIQANAAPAARNIGDQWWDTVNSQLNSWNGSVWQLIGPGYTSAQGVSGQLTANIVDSNAISHTTVKGFVSGNLVSVYSIDNFIPVATPGFTNIITGLNLANTVSLSANTATFATNVSIGQTLTVNAITSNLIVTTANLTANNLNITNAIHAATLYDNSNRVVTSVTQIAGQGIAISNQTNVGPATTATITNTGVLTLTVGAGLTATGATGNVRITNSGVTSAIPGIGMHLSNTTGDIQFSIGQEVGAIATPTFNGIYVTGDIRPTSNIAINLGQPQAWYNSVNSYNYNGTTYNGTTYNGTTFNGTTYNGTAFTGETFTGNTFTGNLVTSINYHGTTYNGTTYNGTTYNGTTYNGTTYNGTTFSGTAVMANYADLAEKYVADTAYTPGTVVVFGGEFEITVTNTFADVSVAGAISTNPAYLMNNALINGLPVALRGRIPVKVIGPVSKGDLLVTSTTPGCAISVGIDHSYGMAVFAKALEHKTTSEIEIIEAVII